MEEKLLELYNTDFNKFIEFISIMSNDDIITRLTADDGTIFFVFKQSGVIQLEEVIASTVDNINECIEKNRIICKTLNMI